MSGGQLNATDWSTAGNWSSAAKPVDNDDAIISNTLAADVTMSADEGGVDLDLLDVPPLYNFRVGTSAAPIAITSDLIRVYGSSGFYFHCDHNDAATHICDVTLLQCRTPNVPVELGSATTVGAGEAHWDKIVANRCQLTLKANIIWTATGILQVGFVTNPLGDVRAELAAGGPTLPTLLQNGGRVESDVVITLGYICAGTLVQDAATATTLHVLNGATLQLDHTALTTVHVWPGGTLDLMQNSLQKTITTAYFYPGSTIVWEENTANTPGLHTITNKYDYRAGA